MLTQRDAIHFFVGILHRLIIAALIRLKRGRANLCEATETYRLSHAALAADPFGVFTRKTVEKAPLQDGMWASEPHITESTDTNSHISAIDRHRGDN